MKINLTHNPLAPSNAATDLRATYQTRPAWITPRQPVASPSVDAYRLSFHLDSAASIRVHVSADERYAFYVDGQRIGRGPERGSNRIWFYETYELQLPAGAHRFVAIVWQLGDVAPLAQVGLAGGFMLEAEGPHATLISTRSGAWETRPVNGLAFEMPPDARQMALFVEPIQITDGAAYPWGIEAGGDAADGVPWAPVSLRREDVAFPFGIHATHPLQPALLPAQMSSTVQKGRVRHISGLPWNDERAVLAQAAANLPTEVDGWQALIDHGSPVQLPPHTRRQIIIDLEQYICAYPQLLVVGGRGSRIVTGWAEALHTDATGACKGHRDAVAGQTFVALCRDVALPDGGADRLFEPLWWRSGRYVQLLIETGDQPLTLKRVSLLETRYPLNMESAFSSSDPRLDAMVPLALRSLQMCAHETYMDCPYYEQLMYVGDSRLEALTTYAISTDDRLPRKSIQLFDASRLPDGFTQARYPSRDVQVIPPFSLWWIGMVYDYALWRGDRAFVAGLLPGVRAVIDGFLTHVDAAGLVRAPAGWNFSDWTGGWPIGVPPEGFSGHSGLLQWHLTYTLNLASRLEEWVGEAIVAQRWQSWRDALGKSAAAFWDHARGLFADDKAHMHFSEHTQCLALLSGTVTGDTHARIAHNLVNDASLTRATIYFSHYLFETYRLLKQPAALFERLALWFELPSHGFFTTPEQPEPSRSDCHGWGAHPLYHCFATLLGIRPGGFGFDTVEITPMPGDLTHLSGDMVHPRGRISAELRFEDGQVSGQVTLPEGVSGTLSFGGRVHALTSGANPIAL